jgi:CRP-like cAMP-binding protein
MVAQESTDKKGGWNQVVTAQQQVFFPSGSVLFKEGETAAGAYLIVTGEVTTSMEAAAKGTLALGTVQPPAYLALVDSIAGDRYSCTTRAVRDTKGFFIPREVLVDCMADHEKNLTLLQALANEVSASYHELRAVRDKFGGRSVTRKRIS